MKILLLGKNGQVGWELQRSLAPLGELIALDRQEADLENPDQLLESIDHYSPDMIVNAAAYTAVDNAESDSLRARQINTDSVALLANECKKRDTWLIHYSTDYVFDGSGNAPRNEQDITAPLNCYGETKLLGEQAIQSSACKHLIFRTSWVYAARGNNFAKTMLRLAQQRDRLSVIDDQIGAPTGADLIADVTAHAIRAVSANPALGGLYHLVASGEVSWHNYACFVIAQARQAGLDLKVDSAAIDAVPTIAFPTPARRPHNSRLDTEKLQRAFDIVLPDWRIGLTHTLTEIIETIKRSA